MATAEFRAVDTPGDERSAGPDTTSTLVAIMTGTMMTVRDRPELVAVLAPLSDRATTLATAAERAFSRVLGGAAAAPLAAYAEWEEGALWLRGLIASPSGAEVLRGERDAEVDDVEGAELLGRDLADEFLARGASRFLSP